MKQISSIEMEAFKSKHYGKFTNRWGNLSPLEISKLNYLKNNSQHLEYVPQKEDKLLFDKVAKIQNKIENKFYTLSEKEIIDSLLKTPVVFEKELSKNEILKILNQKFLNEEKVVFGTTSTKISLEIKNVLERKSGEISLKLICPKSLISNFAFSSNQNFKQKKQYYITLEKDDKKYQIVTTITGIFDNEVRIVI